ncbi:hypothetical protein ACRQV7_13020 [Caproiciproducens sp. R2]|uniref:hypothetical protein n=1 Tax=Caproiciproducens sp. R2 TaxID=3435187 RepID=UPI004034C5E4
MAKDTAALRKHKAKIASLGMDGDTVFHKSKLLLKIYRDVTWALDDHLEEMHDYAYEAGNQNAEVGFRYLADFAPTVEIDKFAERVCCVCETRMYVELINKALARVKVYPVYGDMYYQILDKQYISRFPLTEPEISEMLNIERSVFYDRKKEALYLFGICLFGYTLPEVRRLFTD